MLEYLDELDVIEELRQNEPEIYRAVSEELSQGTLSWSEAICTAYLNKRYREGKGE